MDPMIPKEIKYNLHYGEIRGDVSIHLKVVILFLNNAAFVNFRMAIEQTYVRIHNKKKVTYFITCYFFCILYNFL